MSHVAFGAGERAVVVVVRGDRVPTRIDLDGRLPSDLIMRAAVQDPSINQAIGPYVSMLGLPSCLDAVEPKAKAVYRSGWRPELTPGPSRAELADIASRAVPARG